MTNGTSFVGFCSRRKGCYVGCGHVSYECGRGRRRRKKEQIETNTIR